MKHRSLRSLYALPALALLVIAGGAPGQQPAPPSKFVMRAGTAASGGKTEVRVRWSFSEGWLPDGGFNLYRIQNGARTKLNAQPIKPTAQTPDATVNIATDRPFKIGQTLMQANKVPAGATSGQLSPFDSPIARPPSSNGVFTAFRDRVQALHQMPGPKLPPDEYYKRETDVPAVKDYLTKLKTGAPAGVKQALPVKPAPPSEADKTREARSQLLVGAMLHPQIAQTLGLAYNDGAVTAGAKYQYALRTIINGQESAADVATCEITVGADPQPAAPTGILAMQSTVEAVDLRWDRVTVDQEQVFGLPSYRITRVDAKNPTPVPVTKVPVVIGALMGKDGHVEPMAFCRDNSVAPGPVTYQVSMIDMFGRESPQTALQFKMEDWHTPPGPVVVYAVRSGTNVTVLWAVNKNVQSSYRVYRRDMEQPDAKLEGLTATPITGEGITGAAVGGALSPDQLDTPDNGDDNLADIPKNQRNKIPRPKPVRRPGPVITFDQSLSWFKFTDKNTPKDRYYKYGVTAVYTTNNRDSYAGWSAAVPIPSDTPLATPTGLVAKVTGPPALTLQAKPIPSPEAGGASTGGQVQNVNQNANLVANGPLKLNRFAGKGRFIDLSSTVTLNWGAVAGTKPVSYRIYRANDSGYASGPAAQPNPTPSAEPNGAEQDVVKTGSLSAFQALPAKMTLRKYQDIKIGQLPMRYLAQITIIPDSAYALIGVTKDMTTFSDTVPRSHSHYYRYRVVAVNRWGLPSKPAEVSVRVPATMPPTIPTMLAVNADDSGRLNVVVRANADEEEVVKYHVFRNNVLPHFEEIQIQLNHAPSAEAGGAQLVQGGKAKVNATFVGRPLMAKGTVADKLGAGAARFGIVTHDSLYAGISQAAPSVKGPLTPSSFDNVSITPNLKSEIDQLFNTKRFTEIGAADGTKKDANGLVAYPDAGVTPQIHYGYYVVGENKDGIKSMPSSILDASPFKALADPTVLNVPTYSQNAVRLTWTEPKDHVGYIVQRAVSPNGALIQISGIRMTASFADYSARRGQTYIYGVIALDSSGNLSKPSQQTYTVPR